MTDAVLDIVGRRTLDQLLESAARGREGDVFVLLADGREVSYGELLGQRREAEAILRAQGVRRGDAVLVHMPTSLRQVVLMFGLYRLGAVAAMSNPVNTLREVNAIVRRSGARLLVVDDESAELIAGLRSEGQAVLAASAFDRVLGVTAGSASAPSAPSASSAPSTSTADELPLTPESPATMIFTSGTTSEPKCVVYKHGHQVFGAESYASRLGLLRNSLLMHHFPLFHMNGLNQLTATLLSGARLLVVDDESADVSAGLRSEGQAVLAASAFDRVLGATAASATAQSAPAADEPPLTPESPATMIFTSGTTSEPKCVVYKQGHQVFVEQPRAEALQQQQARARKQRRRQLIQAVHVE